MKVQVSSVNFSARNKAGMQYELQILQRYCTGDESDLPPPNTQAHNRSGGDDFEEVISLDRLRDELDQEEPLQNAETTSSSFENPIQKRLLSEAINPEALPSGQERVRSIQLVMAVFTAQVVLTSVFAVWLTMSGHDESNYLHLAAFAAVVAAALAFNSWGTIFHPLMVVACFGVFSAALPFALTLVACLMDRVVLIPLLVQLSAMSLGLCLYAWITKYEDWSGKEELFFMVIPIIFASLILTLLFAASPLLVGCTGVLTVLLGIVIADCTKDNFVPAKSLDQLLSDTLTIHVSIIGRATFLFKIKICRLARKSNWF